MDEKLIISIEKSLKDIARNMDRFNNTMEKLAIIAGNTANYLALQSFKAKK